MKKNNNDFICENCGTHVPPHANSSRNHCNLCLFSKHMDLNEPGDRLSLCYGVMKPVSLEYSGKKGDIIVHKCEKCGKVIKNKMADDDNWDAIIQLSMINEQ